MEMNMAKFSEKLGELMELAKKKKNVLEYQEINDFFKDFPLARSIWTRFLISLRQMELMYCVFRTMIWTT